MGGLKVLQGDESVVKEAEIRLGMNAGSLGDKMKNYTDQIISGRSLQPRQREEIIKTVRALSDISKKRYLEEIKPFITTAQRKNLPLNELVSDEIIEGINNYNKPDSIEPAKKTGSVKPNLTKTVVKKGYNAKTNQTILIYSDGTQEVLDGRR